MNKILTFGFFNKKDILVYIKLAYIAIPGYEYYDNCVELDILKSNPDNSEKTPPRKGTIEQEMSNIFPIVTPRKSAEFLSPRKRQSR